jgi:hypothetical protein
MRRNRSSLGGLLILLTVAACSSRREPAEIPDPVIDGRIHSELQARIQAEPALEAPDLRIEVEAGRVQLYGSVAGIGAWNCLLRNAWLVEGVESVNDFLIIERGPRDVTCRAVRGRSRASSAGAPNPDP